VWVVGLEGEYQAVEGQFEDPGRADGPVPIIFWTGAFDWLDHLLT
jgi:hypothetical protein